MIPPFDEALADLIEHYSHYEPNLLIGIMEREIEELRSIQKELDEANGQFGVGA